LARYGFSHTLAKIINDALSITVYLPITVHSHALVRRAKLAVIKLASYNSTVRPIPVSGIGQYSPVSMGIGIGRYLF